MSLPMDFHNDDLMVITASGLLQPLWGFFIYESNKDNIKIEQHIKNKSTNIKIVIVDNN